MIIRTTLDHTCSTIYLRGVEVCDVVDGARVLPTVSYVPLYPHPQARVAFDLKTAKFVSCENSFGIFLRTSHALLIPLHSSAPFQSHRAAGPENSGGKVKYGLR